MFRRGTLIIPTGSDSGTHTHAGRKKQASSLALSRAPVCGMRRLPEGSRRDTGGVSVTLPAERRRCFPTHPPAPALGVRRFVVGASFQKKFSFGGVFGFSASSQGGEGHPGKNVAFTDGL